MLAKNLLFSRKKSVFKAEINKGLDEQQHESMTAMAYDEIKFVKGLSVDQSTKLHEALKVFIIRQLAFRQRF